MYTVDNDICTGCGACVEICPAEAIQCEEGVAVIDDEQCIYCGVCERECPSGAVLVDGGCCCPPIPPPGEVGSS